MNYPRQTHRNRKKLNGGYEVLEAGDDGDKGIAQ